MQPRHHDRYRDARNSYAASQPVKRSGNRSRTNRVGEADEGADDDEGCRYASPAACTVQTSA